MQDEQSGNCDKPKSISDGWTITHHLWPGRTTTANTVEPIAYISLSEDGSEVEEVCVNVARAKTLSKADSAKNMKKVNHIAVNNLTNG